MMPCLNEEKVILNSLQRLMSIPGDDFGVLVIDDGSDDRTVDVRLRRPGERVWLLSRKPPQARQGKGEALNAAIRYLIGSGYLADRDPASVIVVVVDADGRLDPQSIEQVRPYFADPSIGAVQIGVRINNREQQPAGADAGHGVRHLHRGVPAGPTPPGKRRPGRQRPVHAAVGDDVARAVPWTP